MLTLPRRLFVLRRWSVLLLLLLWWTIFPTALANPLPIPGAATTPGALATLRVVPQPPSDITASSYLLMDFDSGIPIAALDPHVEREPASLAKIMTAYVVFGEVQAGRASLQEKVRISERAWRTGMTGGSRMFIQVGEEVTLEDLLRGMIIQSGNDAATALAERVAGSEGAFVDLMNVQARALGLRNSYFTNPHGLPGNEPQYTTAADMALLARALIRDFPQLYGYYREKSFTFNNISQNNRNLLLWRDESFDGLKTGWTSTAGYNLVSSAKRNDRRLIAVVMGIDAPDHARGGTIRANESQSLINWGLRFFASDRLYDANEVLQVARVYQGEQKQVSLGIQEPFWVVFPQGQREQVQVELRVREPFVAPLAAGEALGEVVATLRGEVVARQPVVALESVDAGGIFRWLWDATILSIRGAWPW